MTAKRKKKRKLKKKFIVVCAIFSAVVLVFAGIWAAMKFVPGINFLPVSKIVITGDMPYSAEIIAEASEIKIGTGIFKFDFGRTEKKIEGNLPYVKDAKLSYSLNGELKIHITGEKEAYSVKHNGFYLLMNESFKILDSVGSSKDTLMLIYGVETLSNESGSIGLDENDEKVKLALKIEKILKENGLTVGVIDLSDTDDIKLVYQNRFIVELGTEKQLEDKIKMLKTITADIKPDEKGRILLKYWSDEDRQGSVINENVDIYINKY